MCIQNALQQHILDITNDGEDIVNFFYATMRGQNPNAKFHHQMEAANQLRKLGLPIASGNAEASQSPLSLRERVGVRAEAPSLSTAEDHVGSEDRIDTPSPSTGEGWDGGENSVHPEPRPELVEGHNEDEQIQNPPHPVHPVKSAPVTDFDIINYEVTRLIREETNDGYHIADFLTRVMHGTSARLVGFIDKKQVVSEADRMAAAKELMNRGLGKFGDTRNRRISSAQDDHELIHSGLARYIRERTDHGLEPARFLLDVASGQDESFSMHQRVTATRELVRRGWDTNYDAVTPDDIAAYYERQDALEPTGYDIRLQEWRDKERERPQPAGATGQSPEESPQLEAGIFAHLSEAEIAHYEALSAEGQAGFVEQQRQRHAASPPAAAHQITPSPSTEEGLDGDDSHEDINLNTLLQDLSVPTDTHHPSNPVHPVKSQTHIRSP